MSERALSALLRCRISEVSGLENATGNGEFESLLGDLADVATLNMTVEDEHEPEVERYIRML